VASDETRTGRPLPSPREEEPTSVLLLRRVDQAVGLAETALLVVWLVALVGVGVFQLVASHLFDKNETWPYELVRYSVFFIAMTAAALAAQRQRMIHMDVVTRMLSPRTRAVLRILTGLFVIAICLLLFQAGMDLRATESAQSQNYAYIPASTGYLALPIGAALIGFHFAIHALIEVLYLAGGKVAPEPETGVH
jgi:TRAP-type C4-dicarboxylate transport system permease small subunit